MIIRLLSSKIDFSKNKLGTIVVPDIPDIPDVPGPSVPEDELVVPELYTTFADTYGRDSLTTSQKTAVATYLYKLNQAGILSKVRQLYMPCIAQDWSSWTLNVARYFNEGKEERTTFDGYQNSTLGQCFEICNYGIYRTSTEIKWGDTLMSNWPDADVTMDNCHMLMFKPGPMDATTGEGSMGMNVRSRSNKCTQDFSFQISGPGSTTQRVRGNWASGSIKIDGTSVNFKGAIFAEPTGWGNGTHDPCCTGISILTDKMITPASSYQEFGYNNRNLVNEINEWPLTGNYELPTNALTGTYSWGGYQGSSISTQQSLATSIISIGQGLTATEIQQYMDITDEFMEALDIKNNNWDPDKVLEQ